MQEIRDKIRNIPDFPKIGIQFKDITTLLNDGPSFARVIDLFDQRFAGSRVDKIVGVESRGFIFGGALAYKWQVGFVPARKPGKLPGETVREEYALEYGSDALEMHADAIAAGERVLIIDDLIATGGTLEATAKLVRNLGGEIVGIAAVIDLSFLQGRRKISEFDVFTLVEYDEG